MTNSRSAPQDAGGAVDWTRLAGDDVTSHPLYPLFYPRSVAVVIARVSQPLIELPEVLELDFNPVPANAVGGGCIAGDGLADV